MIIILYYNIMSLVQDIICSPTVRSTATHNIWFLTVRYRLILKGYSSSRDPVSLDISWDVEPAVKKWRVGDESIFSQLAQYRGWISSDSGSWQDE